MAWRESKSLRCRPSDLYGVGAGDDIGGDFARFSFDTAVFTFGTALDAELDEVDGKNKEEIKRKRTSILNRWIPKASDAEPEAKPVTAFADPAKR